MKNLSWLQILKRAASMVYLNWQAMVCCVVVVWFIQFILLTPAAILILDWLIASGPDVIVSNSAVVDWLLTPKGFLCFFLTVLITLFSVCAQTVGLFWIANAAREGKSISAKAALSELPAALPKLLRYCFSLFVVCFVFLLLLAIGIGIIYFLLLRAHDINYYLTAQPPEWYFALTTSAVWGVLCVAAVSAFALRWIYILPLMLDRGISTREAFLVSWKKTRHKTRKILLTLGGCSFLWLSTHIVIQKIIFWITGFVLMWVGTSIAGIVFVVSIYLILLGVIEGIVFFIGIAWLSCVWVVCYWRDLDLPVKIFSMQAKRSMVKQAKFFKTFLSSKAILFLLILLIVVGAGVSFWIWTRPVSFECPVVIAHRAGSVYAPENTLAAVDMTLKRGASDYIEIDVQLTKDGQVVLAHDKDLMKLANNPAVIAETSYADLKKIDIGSSFSPKFKGERVALLSDVLKRIRGRLKILIELKNPNSIELVEKVAGLVRKYKMMDDAIIMSLELKDVRNVQRLDPDLKVGYFASIDIGDLTRLDVNVLAPSKRITTSQLVANAHRNHLVVYTWTVDDEARMVELMTIGVDGLITNDPVLARKIITQIQSLTSQQRLLLQFRRFWSIFEKEKVF